MCFPYGSQPSELKTSVILECNTSDGPDVSSIGDELEIDVAKDLDTITDFQEEPQPKARTMQFTHIKTECDLCTFTDLEGHQIFKTVLI